MKSLILLILLPCLISCQSQRTELEKLFLSGKYDEVIQHAESVLQLNPNDIEANSFLGQSLVRKKNYKISLDYLNKADELENENLARKLWINLNIAIAYYQLDNYSEAQNYVTKCIRLNSTPYGMKEVNQFAVSCGFKEFYPKWRIVETEHFRFHFPTNTVVENIDNYIESRENAFTQINDFFNSEIPKKIDFIVWNDGEDAQKLGIKSLGLAKPEYCLVHSRHNQTLGHEMTHIISYYLTDNPIRKRFINEGISVAFDLTNENKLDLALKSKGQENFNKSISIVEAWNNPKQYPEWVYYPFAGEFIKRLIAQCGKEKFLVFATNQTCENAQKIYGELLDNIIARLENDIN